MSSKKIKFFLIIFFLLASALFASADNSYNWIRPASSNVTNIVNNMTNGTYVLKTGDTMTGSLLVNPADGSADPLFEVETTGTNQYGFEVGTYDLTGIGYGKYAYLIPKTNGAISNLMLTGPLLIGDSYLAGGGLGQALGFLREADLESMLIQAVWDFDGLGNHRMSFNDEVIFTQDISVSGDIDLGSTRKINFDGGSYITEEWDGGGHDIKIHSRSGHSFGYGAGTFFLTSLGTSYFDSIVSGLETGAANTHILRAGATTGQENNILKIGSGGVNYNGAVENAVFSGKGMAVVEVGTSWESQSVNITKSFGNDGTTVDSEYTIDGSPINEIGTYFTATRNETLTHIVSYLKRTVPGTVSTVKGVIRAYGGVGSPPGAELAETYFFTLGSNDYTQEVRILATPLVVTAGTTYWIGLRHFTTAADTNLAFTTVPGGISYRFDGVSTWTIISDEEADIYAITSAQFKSTDAAVHGLVVGQGVKLIADFDSTVKRVTVSEIVSTTEFRVDETNDYKFVTADLYIDGDLANLEDCDGNVRFRVDKLGNVINDGDMHVSGNITGNQIYGGMWISNRTGTNLNFAVDGTFYQLFFINATHLNGFEVEGLGHNLASNLTAQIEGLYLTNYMASGDGQNNHVYSTSVFINEVNQNNCENQHKMAAGGDIITQTGSCLIRLSVGDKVSLRTADVGGTGTGNYYSSNLNLVRIGD